MLSTHQVCCIKLVPACNGSAQTKSASSDADEEAEELRIERQLEVRERHSSLDGNALPLMIPWTTCQRLGSFQHRVCALQRRWASRKRRPAPAVSPVQKAAEDAKFEPSSQAEAYVLQFLGLSFVLIILEGLALAASVRR